MGLIEIEGMHFYAYHGHFATEQIVGNEFEVDVALRTDCTKAGASDELEDALNYQEVYNLVKEEMQIKSKLLEHVGKRIQDRLHQTYPEIEWSRIKISKMNPPMGGEIERVSVTLTR